MKKSLLKKYAELVVREGIALKKGQSVLIRTNVDQEEFTALVVEECYRCGAKYVHVSWSSEKVNRVTFKKGTIKNLSQVTPMEEALEKWFTDELPCMLWIDSDNPDAFSGLDAKKIAAIRRAKIEKLYHYREQRESKYQWCICGAPSDAWAKKMFPELSKSKAREKLWEAILLTSRALDGNGIENWHKHNAELKKRCAYLNSLRLRWLKYSASNGTDLTVGLIPGVIFQAASEKTLQGVEFEPNIPSEECFTSPRKGEAEGIVYSAKPLAYQGTVIKNFWVKFHEGKAVEVHAEEGEDALRSILEVDEGSAYLGECALVPFDSPINNTGLLFYNTLYDENAACHLALGAGFLELYPEFEKYTPEQIHGFGINKSRSHVDFMIGCEDLNILGIDESGKEITIFKNGNWAF